MFSLNRSRLLRWRVLLKGWRIPGATVGLVVTTAVLPFTPRLVDLPQILAAGLYLAPRTILAALVVSLITLTIVDEPCDQIDVTAAVPLPAARAIRMVGFAGLAITSITIGGGEFSASAGLAVLTMIGEGLLVVAFFESAIAWLLPTAHLFAAATFGVTAARDIAGWAWIIRVDVTPGSLSMSLLLFSSGLYCWSHARTRR